MKKALLYVVPLIIFLLVGVPIVNNGEQQNELKQQEISMEQSRDKLRLSSRDQLVKCIDSARTAWTDALKPENTAALAHTGDLYYAYMQSMGQVRQAQVAECAAEYRN